nr:hypothetical protein GCM10020092_037960 [Actinoplanes digitatis]
MDHQPLAPVLGTHGLALAFYNPYFLIHAATEQRLETRAWWDDLFDRLGLTAEATAHPDPPGRLDRPPVRPAAVQEALTPIATCVDTSQCLLVSTT